MVHQLGTNKSIEHLRIDYRLYFASFEVPEDADLLLEAMEEIKQLSSRGKDCRLIPASEVTNFKIMKIGF